MTQGAHVPTHEILEVAHAWHHVADCQRRLDLAAARAHAAVVLEPPSHATVDFDVTIEEKFDRIILRVTARGARPEAVRAWATPDLVLLRAHRDDGTTSEHLVRLPATVDPDSAEIERDGDAFAISLERRNAVPTPLWPAER